MRSFDAAMEIRMRQDKVDAFAFLDKFARAVAEACPKGTSMAREIRRTTMAAKDDEAKKHLRSPEAAFLNRFVIPVLFDQIKQHSNIADTEARKALLNEYFRCMPDFSKGTPAHPKKHPFKKILGGTPGIIYAEWANPDKNSGLTQSCPDFALTEPFPHHIVFEGKYFEGGSKAFAERELVKNIYQAFFYRGLPRANAAKNGHPEWNYEYACLLAFDASRTGSLKSAWNALAPAVQQSFWDGANIFVMILGGEGDVPDH
jgi:hypothetical protein